MACALRFLTLGSACCRERRKPLQLLRVQCHSRSNALSSCAMAAPVLATSIGDFTLQEYCLRRAERSWSFLHTGAVVTIEQESRYLARESDRLPYGVMLWPASIALAHDVLSRAELLRGKRVLELGA